MNEHEVVVKPDSYLIRRICAVLNPKATIAKQNSQPFGNLVKGHANRLFGFSVFARPFPSLVKHLLMQFPDVLIRNHVDGTRTVLEGPFSP
jgi:hypothetical protein